LTDDGSDTIINGTSDWVYEEEFGLRDGFRWSPNSKWIAYWQFDTTGVRKFRMINNIDGLYPKITTFNYPKVGQQNSACKVGAVRIGGGPTHWFELSDDSRNHYIPKMDWADNSREIVVQQLNRLQNTNEVILANVRRDTARTVFTDRDEAWLDVTDALQWLDDGKRFTWLSERDDWRHLYTVSRTGKKVTLLTPGSFDVIRLVRIDEQAGWVYYIASPDNPTQQYLYRCAGWRRSNRADHACVPGRHPFLQCLPRREVGVSHVFLLWCALGYGTGLPARSQDGARVCGQLGAARSAEQVEDRSHGVLPGRYR